MVESLVHTVANFITSFILCWNFFCFIPSGFNLFMHACGLCIIDIIMILALNNDNYAIVDDLVIILCQNVLSECYLMSLPSLGDLLLSNTE